MAKNYKCRVEYLESTGTQWIDTEIAPSNITPVVKLKFIPTQQYGSGNYGIFGCFGADNTRFQVFYNSIGIGTYVSKSWQANTTYEVELNGKIPSATINGTVETSGYSKANGFSSYNMYLFTRNNLGTADSGIPLKLYYCKIWNNEILVRDFIPVLDLSGKPAMYDQVSGKLFYNKGTGEFTYGRQIIPVEYLESTGTQYIDTGIYGTEDLETELICQQLQRNASSNGKGIFGAFNSTSANSYYLYQQGEAISHWQVGFGSYLNTSTEIDLNKHTFNFSNYKVYMDGTEIASLNTGSMNTTPYTLLLFNTHRNNGTLYDALPQRFYSVKFIRNGVLVRDFIPAIDENLTPFMFDKVNCTVYLNAGTGQFKVGPNVEKMWCGKKLRRKLALALANLKKKRKYYTELEYLESTGTQYIDTGVVFSNSSHTYKWDIGAQAVNTGNTEYNWFCGFFEAGVYSAGTYSDTTTNRTFYPVGTYYQNGQVITNPMTSGDKYGIIRNVFTITNFAGTLPIILFGRNQSNGIKCEATKKIFYYKIYDNDVLVRDLIPVLGWDGKGYMYDKVSGQLFGNAGTGDFVAGRQIHPVEYLESTGTQYIDTRVNGDSDKTYDMSFYVPSNEYNGVFGSWKTTDTTCRFTVLNGSNARLLYFRFNALEKTYTKSSDAFVFSAQCTKNSVTVNGSILSYEEQTFNTENSIFVFGINVGSTQLLSASGTKCYYCKIYDNGTLVRDFIPAIDENDVGFVFDRVTHTIFDNAGVGAFAYPPVELEYLESSGVQWIDTGYTGNSNTKVEVKCYSENTSQNRALFGARDGSTYLNSFTIWQTANNKIRFDYSADTSETRTTIAWDATVPHILMKDAEKNYVDGVQQTSNATKTFTCNYPFSLFGVNTGGTTAGSTCLVGRVYYCKIWNGEGVLVRDFIPVFYNGAAGMWDKVNSVFYPNAGTGAFTTSKIVEPEYE